MHKSLLALLIAAAGTASVPLQHAANALQRPAIRRAPCFQRSSGIRWATIEQLCDGGPLR